MYVSQYFSALFSVTWKRTFYDAERRQKPTWADKKREEGINQENTEEICGLQLLFWGKVFEHHNSISAVVEARKFAWGGVSNGWGCI